MIIKRNENHKIYINEEVEDFKVISIDEYGGYIFLNLPLDANLGDLGFVRVHDILTYCIIFCCILLSLNDTKRWYVIEKISSVESDDDETFKKILSKYGV